MRVQHLLISRIHDIDGSYDSKKFVTLYKIKAKYAKAS